MVLTEKLLPCNNNIRHSVPSEFRLIVMLATSRVKNVCFLFPGDFLLYLRVNRLLLHISADGAFPVWNVLDRVLANFVCRPKCWPRGRSCNERSERCVLSARHVSSIPSLLRILRFLRRHSDLLAMDHVFVLHPLWIWSYSFGNVRIWTREAQVLPNILSLQVTNNDVGGTRYAQKWYYARHCCLDRYLCHLKNRCFLVLEMEVEETTLKTIWSTFVLHESRWPSFPNENK